MLVDEQEYCQIHEAELTARDLRICTQSATAARAVADGNDAKGGIGPEGESQRWRITSEVGNPR